MNSIERVFLFWKRLGQVRTEVAEESIWDLANVYLEGKVARLSIITLAKCSTLLFVLWGKITSAFHRQSVRSILHDNVRCFWVTGNETKSRSFILKLSRGWNFKKFSAQQIQVYLRLIWGSVNGIGCFSSHPSRHIPTTLVANYSLWAPCSSNIELGGLTWALLSVPIMCMCGLRSTSG